MHYVYDIVLPQGTGSLDERWGVWGLQNLCGPRDGCVSLEPPLQFSCLLWKLPFLRDTSQDFFLASTVVISEANPSPDLADEPCF